MVFTVWMLVLQHNHSLAVAKHWRQHQPSSVVLCWLTSRLPMAHMLQPLCYLFGNCCRFNYIMELDMYFAWVCSRDVVKCMLQSWTVKLLLQKRFIYVLMLLLLCEKLWSLLNRHEDKWHLIWLVSFYSVINMVLICYMHCLSVIVTIYAFLPQNTYWINQDCYFTVLQFFVITLCSSYIHT